MSQGMKIRRVAVGKDVRKIEITIGSGKEAVTRTLSTDIVKVERPEKFAKIRGGKTSPIEQYAFRVNDEFVGARFADAAAVVMKQHGVEIPAEGLENRQAYVQKAVQLMQDPSKLQNVVAEFK